MADALDGGNVQALQQFIGVGAWDDEAILARHQQLIAETLGESATGVLIVDGCDFPKQGTHSVGVVRQYCGPLGKVANCQASVVACYASARGYALVDRRLSLHEDWFSEPYRVRRQRCGVPPDTPFRTRTELAWDMIAGLRRRGALPFCWVTGDEHFGNTPSCWTRSRASACAISWRCPITCGCGGNGPWRRGLRPRGRRPAPLRGPGWGPAPPRRCGWMPSPRNCRPMPGSWHSSTRAAKAHSWRR